MHDKLVYIDDVECAKKLIKILKEDKKCDLIVALTHMRIPNEKNLAVLVPEIDIMLGGHDHVYYIELIDDVFLLKSGTDF